jgi:hypothetical protein
VEIRLQGAFSDYDVIVPEGTPVRHHGPGFPINFVSKGPATDGISDEEPGYQVIIEGAFTMLDIEEGPAPEGGWPPLPEPAEAPDADVPTEALPVEAPAEGESRPPAEDPDGAAPSDALT